MSSYTCQNDYYQQAKSQKLLSIMKNGNFYALLV
jgi:hypothetical protein